MTCGAPSPLFARLLSWCGSWTCLALGVAWGFAEGTLWFIVPDLIITFAAVFSVKQSLRQIGAVLAGSLAAGMVMYWLGAQHAAAARNLVAAVPFVSAHMTAVVDAGFARDGVWSMLHGPLSGIPYKVYAVYAPSYVALLPFVLVSVPARLMRLVASWALFAAGGALARRWIAAWPRAALVVYALYWSAVYAWYWFAIS